MSVLKFYAIRCDHCGYRESTEFDNVARVRRTASVDGWTRPRANQRSQMRIDVCPDCSDKE